MIFDIYSFLVIITTSGIAVYFIGAFQKQEENKLLLTDQRQNPPNHTSRIWNMLKDNDLVD